MSQCKIFLSQDPLDKHLVFQFNTPTQLKWPSKVQTISALFTSQICIDPKSVPTASYTPSGDHPILVIESD